MAITGGAPIKACGKYGAPFTYTPRFTPWMAGNHKPAIQGTDDGIWRRVHLIPFTQTFAGDRRDPNIEQKLLQELPGILNWAIEGCLKWQAEGLNPPPVILEATAEYRSDQDTIGRWLNECCTVNILLETPAGELLKSFNKWAEENGHRGISSKTLGAYLGEHGYQSKKKSCKYWQGLGLNDDYATAAANY
jgi:putative DNA primase/helicase